MGTRTNADPRCVRNQHRVVPKYLLSKVSLRSRSIADPPPPTSNPTKTARSRGVFVRQENRGGAQKSRGQVHGEQAQAQAGCEEGRREEGCREARREEVRVFVRRKHREEAVRVFVRRKPFFDEAQARGEETFGTQEGWNGQLHHHQNRGHGSEIKAHHVQNRQRQQEARGGDFHAPDADEDGQARCL